MANYYYNGELLPEVPVVEGYPYYCIRKNIAGGSFDVFFSQTGFKYDKTVSSTSGQSTMYSMPIDKSEQWAFGSSTIWGIGVAENKPIIFSNSDIMNGSSVWLAGSDPVPETPVDEKKYLIKNYTSDGYELLTVAGGDFQTLSTTEINAQTFQTYGFDALPSSDLLITLSKFDVLLWHSNVEDLPTLSAEITATPSAQTIVTDLIDISDETILGVESITAITTGNPLFALSFDGKQTWEAWTGSAWATLDSAVSGMTKELLESITGDQWTTKVAGMTGFYLKFILHDNDVVESVVVDFKN